MSLCLTLGTLTLALPVSAFTLAWTHSVEKTRWEEDWRIEDGRLVLEEARVQGSGAGMDPPPEAVRDSRFWRWRPGLPPVEALNLARSPAVEPYTLCFMGDCHPLDTLIEDGGETPVRLAPCKAP